MEDARAAEAKAFVKVHRTKNKLSQSKVEQKQLEKAARQMEDMVAAAEERHSHDLRL